MSLAPFSSLTFSTTLWSFYPHVLLPHHALNGLSKGLEHAVWTFSFQNYEVNKFLFFIKYLLQALHCSNGKPVDVQHIRLYQCIASTALPFPSLCRDHRTVCLKLWWVTYAVMNHWSFQALLPIYSFKDLKYSVFQRLCDSFSTAV